MAEEITGDTGNPGGAPSAGATGAVAVGTGGGQGSGGVGGNLDFHSTLPKEFQGEKSLATIKDLGSLAKGYVEAQKMIGGSIRIPKTDAKPEEWDGIYDKLGRPKTAEEYQLNMPDMGDIGTDEKLMSTFLQTAHKIGLNHKQVQALLDMQTGHVKSQIETMKGNLKDTLGKLQEEWGPGFTKKAVLAQRAVKEFGGTEVEQLLERTGLGNHPAVIKLFSRVGEILAEDGFISGKVEGVSTPDEAKNKIASIMSDKTHPYHDGSNPLHNTAVEEMQKLYHAAYGE